MGKKKGRQGQKKLQGQKAKVAKQAKKNKVVKAKSKARKSQSKAVKTNLKKMTFDNSKKIEVLNADITKVLLAPAKLQLSASSQPQPVNKADRDEDMPDVGSVAHKLDQAAL
ncbi:uncharacterized protein LOC131957446 [Physella acuta]|uniref:uncharacterized protein LOC131957446 n=1 Tax=Physella acuta TaxID=109671 RepID=UPI0027DC754B|nr:uncharacterized protein LOC131957446 [Physella acuta]XP_059178247.1 uncharacterized protein LOC131957446 [Physella acuta]